MLRGAITTLALAITAFLTMPQPVQAILPDGFAAETVGTGMQFPVGFAILPDGRALVIEQYSAEVKLVENMVVSTVAKIPNVSKLGERGLQGIAVDPAWPTRPYVYLHYTVASPPSVRISRFTATGDLDGSGFMPLEIDTSSRYDILAGLQDATHVHQGGTIRFGKDSTMYVSLGEDHDPCLAQDLMTLEGSILRLDISGLPPGPGGPPPREDLVAMDNPFETAVEVNTRLIWAYGLRNPFRFAIDRKRDDLFVADVGAVTYEEINYTQSGGENFGWPWLEGTTPIASCTSPPGTYTGPIFGYEHSLSGPSSIIAAVVYRRKGNHPYDFPPAYEGDFFYCDYYSGEMTRMDFFQGAWRIAPPVAGQPSATVWGTGFVGATDFQLGPDASIWYTAHQSGQLRRITFIPGAVDVPIVHRPVPTPLYFDIQGRRVDRPGASGVYFVRGGKNGFSKKVILK